MTLVLAIPAQAGTQLDDRYGFRKVRNAGCLGPGLRRDDGKGRFPA
jgi:hypothetical protein